MPIGVAGRFRLGRAGRGRHGWVVASRATRPPSDPHPCAPDAPRLAMPRQVPGCAIVPRARRLLGAMPRLSRKREADKDRQLRAAYLARYIARDIQDTDPRGISRDLGITMERVGRWLTDDTFRADLETADQQRRDTAHAIALGALADMTLAQVRLASGMQEAPPPMPVRQDESDADWGAAWKLYAYELDQHRRRQIERMRLSVPAFRGLMALIGEGQGESVAANPAAFGGLPVTTEALEQARARDAEIERKAIERAARRLGLQIIEGTKNAP